MKYLFLTKCPRCGKKGEAWHESRHPVINCGDCLMEATEIVALELTLVEQEEDDDA